MKRKLVESFVITIGLSVVIVVVFALFLLGIDQAKILTGGAVDDGRARSYYAFQLDRSMEQIELARTDSDPVFGIVTYDIRVGGKPGWRGVCHNGFGQFQCEPPTRVR